MISPGDAPSRGVLERIAADHRARGYDVVVEPRGSDLPAFLVGTTPDLIAHRGGEHIVIEVKSSPQDVDRLQLTTIADRVAAHHGWRFVLMASDPRVNDRSVGSVLDEGTVRRRLDEARSLADSGHSEAALLLAWGALEALLRRIVDTEEGRRRNDPASLLRSAASEGLVGPDDWTRLNEAFRVRTAIAHGTQPLPEPGTQDPGAAVRALTRIAESLLSELGEVD